MTPEQITQLETLIHNASRAKIAKDAADEAERLAEEAAKQAQFSHFAASDAVQRFVTALMTEGIAQS